MKTTLLASEYIGLFQKFLNSKTQIGYRNLDFELIGWVSKKEFHIEIILVKWFDFILTKIIAFYWNTEQKLIDKKLSMLDNSSN